MSEKVSTLGVILVEPFHVIRTGLKLLVSTEPDMEILAEAGTADEAMELMRALRRRTDVVALVSLGMDGHHDSYWLIRSIRDSFPTFSILASGANVDGAIVSRALFTGADGFIDKATHAGEFLSSIRGAAAGRVVLAGVPMDSFGDVVDGLARQSQSEQILTDREIEVIAVAAKGLTAREIGDLLGVRERTVTTHLGRIYKKLGARSRLSAVAAAHRSGLLSLAHAE